MKNRYIAIIPAYEPDDKLIDLTTELHKRGFAVVVVDDGSGSEFEELFEKVSGTAIVLTHKENLGKGAALKTGMRYIKKYMSYYEAVRSAGGAARISGRDAVVVTVDADGQHLPDDVLRIARIAETRRDAIVLGSRALKEGVPARSRMGNAITRHVYSLSTGVQVHDTQTGLRAFRQSMIPRMLEIKGDRYEYEINVLLDLAAEGVPILEEEIETVYENNNKASHFRTFRDSWRVFREILKFSASSLASFAIDYCVYAALLAATGAAGLANGLIISNIGARLVSGTANYAMNKKLVFNSSRGIAASALQYAALAVLILAGNTIVLSTLTGTFGINSLIAKLITELMFFSISWTVQRYVIFFRETDAQAAPAGKEVGDVC